MPFTVACVCNLMLPCINSICMFDILLATSSADAFHLAHLITFPSSLCVWIQERLSVPISVYMVPRIQKLQMPYMVQSLLLFLCGKILRIFPRLLELGRLY